MESTLICEEWNYVSCSPRRHGCVSNSECCVPVPPLNDRLWFDLHHQRKQRTKPSETPQTPVS
jgi:hypothetical protein